ncbi:MAG: C-GCAxxG-C-C family protein [Proteobacteria bacterium]|nr:C-GCAxxG-C-C family protein [Pseudomonadota bacterium]MBU1717274.1 C-GCAxxG-C-C family protein [Pseudomonadota bacterium]
MEENRSKEQGASRRSFLTTSGKMLAGAALASTVLAGKSEKAQAYAIDTGYKYALLDPQKVGQIAYENYAKRWCASSVIAGLVNELAAKVGGPWKTYPIDAMRWAHGGFAGWGALCGTLTGAGAVIGLIVPDTDIAEAMTNDLAFYYSSTELPSFTPPKNLIADIESMTIAGTPVCHISVGRFMKKEEVDFLSNERAERCARLAGNIAMEATNMLNEWKKNGKYTPKHKPLFNVLANGITSQNNCTDCHGDNVPNPGNYATITTAEGAECATKPAAGKH